MTDLVTQDHRDDPGPVRLAGTSTAWWGTILLLVVLSSMLSTLLFAYPYLGAGAERWGPTSSPPLGWAVAAAGLVVVSILPAMAMHRSAGLGRAVSVARWALVTAVIGLGFIAVALADLSGSGVSATDDAYGSVRVVTTAFHLIVSGGGVVLLLALPLRLWTAELGVRQRTGAICAALLWYYVVGGWLVVSVMLHLVPVLS